MAGTFAGLLCMFEFILLSQLMAAKFRTCMEIVRETRGQIKTMSMPRWATSYPAAMKTKQVFSAMWAHRDKADEDPGVGGPGITW